MSAYSDAIQAHSSLVSYWRFNETAGPTVADSKGSNAGTAVGSPTFNVSGPIGTGGAAIAFDGSTQYVRVTHNATLNVGNTATMEFWIKRAVVGTRQCLMTKGTQAYDSSIETSNRVNLNSSQTAGIMAATTASAITDTTTWHHVLLAKNGATGALIAIDGVDRSFIFTESAWTNNTSDVLIGTQDLGPSQTFNGAMAEVALYSTALTLTDAQNHYNLGSTSPADNTTRPGMPGEYDPHLVPMAWF